MLHSIVYSERPLTIGELRDAIAINSKMSRSIPFVFSISNLYDHRLKTLEHISKRPMRYCGELVEVKSPNKDINNHGDIVQLFHETVREFLKDPSEAAGPFHMTDKSGHAEIAIVCGRYIRTSLALDPRDNEDSHSPSLTEKSSAWTYENHRMFAEHLSDRPLLAYALKYLPRHMGLLEDQKQAEAILSECFIGVYLGHESRFLSSWLQTSFPKIRGFLTVDIDEAARFRVKSMVAAASQGFATAVQSLVAVQTTLDVVEETINNSALQIAASKGHLQVVDILVEEGASVNLVGGYFGKLPKPLRLSRWLSSLRLQLTTGII